MILILRINRFLFEHLDLVIDWILWWQCLQNLLLVLLLLLWPLNLLLNMLINLNIRVMRGLFFQPFSISECIQSMISRATPWTNACQHHNLCLLTLHEWISQNHSKFARPEWYMLALTSLAFLSVKGSHAFFQSK